MQASSLLHGRKTKLGENVVLVPVWGPALTMFAMLMGWYLSRTARVNFALSRLGPFEPTT